MICAWVRVSDGIVENTIIADPEVDGAPQGFVIVVIPDGASVSAGWSWSPEGGFIEPPPEPDVGGGQVQ